ncbi:MAG: hypothetical protein JXM73_00825 [Anaerolineae bacterium]|nr:hypothetical protein [Anaerolineae bacterium]
MEQFSLDQLRTLLILVIGAIVVLMVVLIAYVMLSSRKKTARGQEGGLPGGGRASSDHSFSAGTQPLSLVRDTEGGPLQVEIGGVRYRSLAEVQDVESKRQIVVAAMELVRFTGVLGQQVEEPAPIDRTYRWREDLRQESQEELKQIRGAPADQPAAARPVAKAAIEEQFLSMLAEMGQASPPEKPGLISSIQHRLTPKGLEERPRTFVDHIEEILQRRMQTIPAFHDRELHMRADPSGAVHFQFDGRDYQDANDIPNLTARQLIADAIKEWEETT